MKIAIAGGTGFVGQELTTLLQEAGHEVIIFTRSERKHANGIRYVQWLTNDARPEEEIGPVDAIVNLAGVSINKGRWNKQHQKQIYTSRMEATNEILRLISQLPQKPKVLVNASAIGIYPASEDQIYTENSTEVATDFLAKTVTDWEHKAYEAKQDGIRVAAMRFGVILGKHEGALPLMVLPYKLFVGGKVGSGKQWLSWIHVKDVARAILFTIENHHIDGPVNTTSPFPKRMDYFGQTIANVLHRPHWLPVPSFAMKMLLGKKSALVLQGQHVVPNVLLDNGFQFQFPTLEAALQNILIESV